MRYSGHESSATVVWVRWIGLVVWFGITVFSQYLVVLCFFFFQAEGGIRDLVRSRGLGDVYK